jgi:hypothetical protein
VVEPAAPTAAGEEFLVAVADAEPIATALDRYARSLTAVTLAADRAAFDTAGASLTKAVEELAKTALQNDRGAPAGPVTALFVAAAGAALDWARLEALRDGVTAADPHIGVLAPALGEILGAMAQTRQTVMTSTGDAVSADMGPRLSADAYASRLAALEGLARRLDGVRRADPAGAAASMVDAHRELKSALADPDRQRLAVLEAVALFAAKAADVKNALSNAPQ